MIGLSFEEINIGDSAQLSRTISESDVYLYAGVTGDNNPAHLDEQYAQKTMFKKRIAHGMLITGLISSVFGNQLPGNGTIYLSQSVRFLAPVYFGDTITARVEVIEKKDEKKRLVCKTTCINQDGKIVIDGEAEVLPPRAPSTE